VWLRLFYDDGGNYAGRTFLDLQPNDRNEIDTADLLAITLLSVRASPRGVRATIAERAVLHDLLDNLPEDDLASAGVASLLAAQRLYLRVRSTLGKSPWVTASKLCARKRPSLVPVRDADVLILLGLAHSVRGRVIPNPRYTADWILYRFLLLDQSIQSNLDDAAHDAQLTDIPRLRLLDTLLWMAAQQR
jgi:hypothetical protein